MDLHMPVQDGYWCSRRLREEGCTVPVIALTANALDANYGRCIAAGMDGCVTKPAKPSALISILQQWLGKKHIPVTTSTTAALDLASQTVRCTL